MPLTVLTLNLRLDHDRWPERLPLIVEVLETHRPDVVAFQEVRLTIDQANRILDGVRDSMPYRLYLAPKQGEQPWEAISLATALPVDSHETTDLPEGERVAQRLRLRVGETAVCVANNHLHHRPMNDERIRLPQMRRLLDWLDEVDAPIILTGDMNAEPESATVQLARSRLRSAYEAVHGHEPAATFPTPMVADQYPGHAVTIDYIFYSPASLTPRDARLVPQGPLVDDPSLFPSDHYGLLAAFDLQGPMPA